MHRIFTAAIVCALFAPLPAAAVTMETVFVGFAGNASDPTDGDDGIDGIQRLGAVPYNYRIGKYEVTNAQYAEFLNAKAATDPYELYSTEMGARTRGGIARSGVSGSLTYTVKPNMADKPVGYVSWFNAVRFVNWLNNGQGSGDTETGAYTLSDQWYADLSPYVTRNPGATWFLPNEDEWYKAAYFQPAAQGGDVDDYWLYPTRSNITPTLAQANSVGDISNPGSNVANYLQGADWNGQNGNFTTVGSAGPLSESFFGTSDQGGNHAEWNESLFQTVFRGIRGGAIGALPSAMESSNRGSNSPGIVGIGFRVAAIPSVPEPSTLALAALGALGLLNAARHRKR